MVQDIIKASMYVQDAGTEIAQIARIIKKIKFRIDIQLVKAHPKQNEPFQ